jgi:uncharacterized protein YqjF (DUF2071 family)
LRTGEIPPHTGPTGADNGEVTVPVTAPPLRRPVIFDQLWCDLTFLHWPVDPEQVAPFFPAGTRPDVFEGRTYVGLVPFRMRRAGPGPRWPIPYFGSFLEVNVRLYSVDEQDRHGVVFRSLDADRLAVVAAARWGMRVPYVWSEIHADEYRPVASEKFPVLDQGTVRHYGVRRRFPGPGPRSDILVTIGPPVLPTALEVFLTARWGMHSAFAGSGFWTPNEHGPWPLHEASLKRLDDTLVSAAGVHPTGNPLRPLWSPGVHARFGRPVRVG